MLIDSLSGKFLGSATGFTIIISVAPSFSTDFLRKLKHMLENSPRNKPVQSSDDAGQANQTAASQDGFHTVGIRLPGPEMIKGLEALARYHQSGYCPPENNPSQEESSGDAQRNNAA